MLKGDINWGSGGLELEGTIRPATADSPMRVEIIGTGRPELNTTDWEYDYNATLAFQWPNGIVRFRRWSAR